MSDTPHDDELLRQYLSDRSVPCPRCKYDLRDLETDVCPECGQTVRLTITPDRPIWRSFAAGLVALAAAAGCNGLMLLFFLYVMMLEGDGELITWIGVTGPGFVLSVAATVAWFGRRGWLLRQRPVVRRAWSLACWVLPILTLAAFIWTVLQY